MSKKINDKRASDGYKFICEVSSKGNIDLNIEMRTLSRNFPTMLQNNGMCVAIAYLLAKNKDAHSALYKKLGDWLSNGDLDFSILTNDADNDAEEIKDLMGALVKLNRENYRMVAKEVMVYMQWVKRFAEGRWDKNGKEI